MGEWKKYKWMQYHDALFSISHISNINSSFAITFYFLLHTRHFSLANNNITQTEKSSNTYQSFPEAQQDYIFDSDPRNYERQIQLLIKFKFLASTQFKYFDLRWKFSEIYEISSFFTDPIQILG